MSHCLYQNHFGEAFSARHHGKNILGLVRYEIHEYQPVLEFEGLLQRAFHVAGPFDLHADMAIALRQFDEIGSASI